MSKILEIWKWSVSSLFIVMAGLALFLHTITRSRAIGQTAVAAIEMAHASRIQDLQSQIASLSKDMNSNSDAIRKAQAEVDNRKEDLNLVYTTTGMSTDDIVARLSSMKL